MLEMTKTRTAVAMLIAAAIAAPSASARTADYGKDQPLSAGAKIGDTPAEFAQPVAATPSRGDTPVDSPGASRAPQYTAPTTIKVVRPERTIVRDVDEVVPVVVSSAALLVAIAGSGFLLVGGMRRRRLGSS
jgi:hypothetical protein